MYYMYFIQSEKYNETYIGSTNDLRRRLFEHNNGVEISTRRYKPWQSVYYEAYRSEKDAREREMKLKKHGNAVKELKKRIQRSIENSTKGLLHTKKNGAGFTLMEAIVAIFVITAGIVGVMTLITQTISFATTSSNRLVAAYLAQEGIEIVRNIRDTNWLKEEMAWDVGLGDCGLPTCEYEADYQSQSLTPWVDPGNFLNIGGDNLYHYSSGSSVLPKKIALSNNLKSNFKNTLFNFKNFAAKSTNFSETHQSLKENFLNLFNYLKKKITFLKEKIISGLNLVKVNYTEEEKAKEFELESLKTVWRADEKPEFKIIPIGKDIFGKLIEKISPKEEPKIQMILIAPGGEEISLREGEDFSAKTASPTKIKIFKPKSFQPGLYKLKITFEKKGKAFNFEQDFSWGVLAINTNKSIYISDKQQETSDTAYIQMAALGDDGHTICDANLILRITNPNELLITEFSTANGTIQYSGKCGPNNVTDVPDYFAYYQVDKPGVYEMKLTNLDNNYEITDSFEVRDSVPFDVERIGPTRIYPPVSYQMTLKIKANQDFEGQIIEQVPASFEIIEAEQTLSTIVQGDTKQIIWNVQWLAGETHELKYQFDAPDISPYLYLLGPLEFRVGLSGDYFNNYFSDYNLPIFFEIRQWQIAVDSRTTWPEACGAAIKGGCLCKTNECSGAPSCGYTCPGRANTQTPINTCSYTISGTCEYPPTYVCTATTQCRTFTCSSSGGNCSYTCLTDYEDCNLGTDGCECPKPSDCCGGSGNNTLYYGCAICNGMSCTACPNGSLCSTEACGTTQYCSNGPPPGCYGCNLGTANCNQTVNDGCECSTPGNCCNGNVRRYNCSICTGGSCSSSVACDSRSCTNSEDCSTKASTDSDGGDVPDTAGTVTDYTGCSLDACTPSSYADHCAGTNNNDLHETYNSGASYVETTYTLGTSAYCSSNRRYTCPAGTANCNQNPSDICECNLTTHHCVGTSCITNLKNDGELCNLGSECVSTNCVDNRCCNTTCAGNCDQCNVAGSLGICTNVNGDCTGNCDVCSGTPGNCAANQNLCSACYDCSGGETSYSCAAVTANTEDTVGTNTCAGACKYCAAAGSCTTITCNEETIGTPCSGLKVCNNAGSCFNKAADGSPCTVGTCACFPSTACIFCTSDYCTTSSVCGSAPYTLTVNKVGSGTITDTGINCGTDCTEDYTSGTTVTLTANPDAGYTFTGWSGDCSGTSTCTLFMDADKIVTATFTFITCPNGVCDVPGGECTTCPEDNCTVAACCGNGICDSAVGENSTNCLGDCPPVVTTKFKRKITILDRIDLDGNGSIDQMTVKVEVFWEEKGETHSIEVQEYLYNWK